MIDKDGKLDTKAFIDMLHGTTDVEKKLNAMSGLSPNMRKKIDDQYKAAFEQDYKQGEAAKAWQDAGARAIQQASEYIAVGGLQPYLDSKKLDAKHVIDTLQREMENGSTLS